MLQSMQITVFLVPFSSSIMDDGYTLSKNLRSSEIFSRSKIVFRKRGCLGRTALILLTLSEAPLRIARVYLETASIFVALRTVGSETPLP